MARRYKTTRAVGKITKKAYEQAQKDMIRRREEAIKAIRKAKVVDIEIRIVYLMLVVIVLMFAISPFVILYRIRKRNKKVQGTKGGDSFTQQTALMNENPIGDINNLSMDASVQPSTSMNAQPLMQPSMSMNAQPLMQPSMSSQMQSYGNALVNGTQQMQKIINGTGTIINDINNVTNSF